MDRAQRGKSGSIAIPAFLHRPAMGVHNDARSAARIAALIEIGPVAGAASAGLVFAALRYDQARAGRAVRPSAAMIERRFGVAGNKGSSLPLCRGWTVSAAFRFLPWRSGGIPGLSSLHVVPQVVFCPLPSLASRG